MNPLISMTPVVDLSLIDSAYTEFLGGDEDYIKWNTGYRYSPDTTDLNEELIRKGVPNNLDCILKVD
jgi:hypothetical protein